MATLIGVRELFEFDLNGYVIIRNFLSVDRVRYINQVLDSTPVVNHTHKFSFMLTDPIFMDLMSHRDILEVCNEWIDPFFRFDHAWGVQHSSNERNAGEGTNLHGGPYQEQSYFQYHWHNGRPTCTCIVFGYVLEPQLAGDGGFVVVPGSHKSNMGLGGFDVFRRILRSDHSRASWVVQPELQAGDLLIFTEAAMHGTKTWQAPDRRRRIIYYKYGYGSLGWPPFDNSEAMELRGRARTEQEQLLLRPPYVSTTTGNELKWREPTLLARGAA
jgi:hypothetical protein